MSMFAAPASALPVYEGLHSFKAGKLKRVPGTNTVKPDPRKGLVYLKEVDDLLHLYWKDRTTNAVEDDLIIFPDEAEFIKVEESQSGRVYALKFNSSSQILFFWMQDKESTADENNITRFNSLIEDPQSVAAPASESTPSGLNGITEMLRGDNIDLGAAARTVGLSQDQLMQILGSEDLRSFMGTPEMSRDERAPETSFVASGADGTTEQDSSTRMRELLAGIQVPTQEETSSEPLDLQDILTPDQVLPLLADPEVRQRLFPHLPATLVSDPPTEAEVREIMTSVQWRQALSGLSYALHHGGESVLRALGVDGEGESGVEAFIRAVSREMGEEESENEDAMEE